MFTGIVRELGRVVAFDGSRLLVEAPHTTAELGDSVAIDGVCLTVVSHDGGQFAFDVVAETLGRTTLGTLAPDDPVNVEPALRAGEPLGGHMVQGHVDGVSLTIAALDDAGFAVALVPHTLAATTLGAAKPGGAVNLEVDVLAKYVERLTMGR